MTYGRTSGRHLIGASFAAVEIRTPVKIVQQHVIVTQQEHLESADLRQGDSGGPDSESVPGIRIEIRTSYPGDFRNLTRASLSKVTFVVKKFS